MTIKHHIEKIINSESTINKADAILYYLIYECRVPLIDNGWLDDDDETYNRLNGICLDISTHLKKIDLLSEQDDRELDQFMTNINASVKGLGKH